MSLVSLIVPVYNEEESIGYFYRELDSSGLLNICDIEVVFVNDGSSDKTKDKISELFPGGFSVKVIDLSRNFGKESALLAGIGHSTGDAVIPMDVDLQDPLPIVIKLIEKWKQGFNVVLAKRVDRSSDSFIKRTTAKYFYKIHNIISEVPLEENVGDFRLLSRSVIDVLEKMPERKVFMKGMFSWVGFDSCVVEYVRNERKAGNTKFNAWKLWNLALEGFTSFSTVPLRVWTYFGSLIAVLSFVYALWISISSMAGVSVHPYSSLMTAILFFGGVQLIGIGVLGEYVGRIYIEVKNRPRYIVKNVINLEKR